MRRRAVLIGLGASVAFARTARAAAPGAPLFRVVADIPLGPGTSRIDYQSLDPAANRLYVAKMGAGTLLAFDIAQGRLAAERPGFPKATGVLAVPDLHRLFVSVPGAGLAALLGAAGVTAGRGAVAVLDTADLHEIARLPGGAFPDGIAYDPGTRRIFVSDERGGALTVIDAVAARPLARIALDGEAGNVRHDPATGRIYVPVQTRDVLAVVDPAALHVLARHALPGARHPHGLAIAPDGGIGYVACDGNDRLLTVDLAAGRVLDAKPLAHDPDVLAIDPSARRLYVAAESGRLSSFDITRPAAPLVLGDVFAGPNAHSVAVDPATHRLYLPLADLDGRAVMRVLSPNP